MHTYLRQENVCLKKLISHDRILHILFTQNSNLKSTQNNKKSACQCRRHEFDSWSRNIPHATGQPSPGTTTTEPVRHSLGAARREATTMRSHCTTTREKPADPAQV